MTLWKNVIKFFVGYFKPYFILQQYTGIKDKNGKDIYEGDILKSFTSVDKICFEYGSFVMKCIDSIDGDGTGGSFWSNRAYIERNSKIIGNIYENPDLLK